MKKILESILILIVLVCVGIEILTESEAIMNSVLFSFQIWYKNIFPSLFPFFVLSELLIHYGFVEFLSELLKGFMYRFFRMSGNASFVFVMSMISGFPSSAKYIRELYLKGLLDESESTKLLMFTHFSNPLFILGTVSLLFLQNKEIGLFILLCHYITNFIIGFLFRNWYKTKQKPERVSLKKAILAMHQKRMSSKKSFGSVVSKALMNSINTLLLILGTVTMFLIVTTILDHNLSLGSYYQSILNGFVEMTQGLKYVSLLAIPLKYKSIMTVMILSFGGLSVHMQVLSILSDTKIKYLPFFTARLLHAAISGILVSTLFDVWMMFL